jgi:biotin carboxyl carrier protein
MSESSAVIAAIQTVSGPSVEDNLANVGALIREAAAAGARLVALPEYFAIMGLRDTDKVDAAEVPGDGPIQSFLAAAAREHGVWLVGGSIPLRSPVAGKVTQVLVAAGDTVQEGQQMVCVEAMKMEMWLCAESAGTVQVLHAKAGDQVESGVVLVELDLTTTKEA